MTLLVLQHYCITVMNYLALFSIHLTEIVINLIAIWLFNLLTLSQLNFQKIYQLTVVAKDLLLLNF